GVQTCALPIWDGPRVPHPEAVLGPRLGLALRVGHHEIAAPRRFLSARHVAPVPLGHLAVAAPEHLAEIHLAGHHDGLTALPRPVERGLEAVREAGVDGDRILQRPRRDATSRIVPSASTPRPYFR